MLPAWPESWNRWRAARVCRFTRQNNCGAPSMTCRLLGVISWTVNQTRRVRHESQFGGSGDVVGDARSRQRGGGQGEHAQGGELRIRFLPNWTRQDIFGGRQVFCHELRPQCHREKYAAGGSLRPNG